MAGTGTPQDPWQLTTPPGTSAYTMYRDEDADPPALVCVVGSTTLKYHLLRHRRPRGVAPRTGRLGAARRGRRAEARGRRHRRGLGQIRVESGCRLVRLLRKGYRGRFGMYLPPLLEALGLAELTHDARNNRMRAV